MKVQQKLQLFKTAPKGHLLKQNIRMKLLSAFFISVAFIVILGVVACRLVSDELESSSKRNSLQTIISQGDYLKLISGTVEAITSQVLISEGVQKMYINARGTLSESDKRKLTMDTADFLDSIVMANAQSINSIAVIGLEDSIFTDKAYKTKSINDLKEMKLYTEALKADRKPVWIGDPDELVKLFDKTKDKSKVNLSCVRVLKENSKGDVVGILIIELNPKSVESVVNAIGVGYESEGHFISSEGFDLRSENTQEEARAADQYKFSSEQLFRDIKDGIEPNGLQSVSYHGEKYIMVYCKPEGTDFVLASLIKMSSLLETSNRILMVTVIVTSIAVICSLTVAFVISGGMSRTIYELVRATEMAASGDLTYRPKSKRRDELGVLTLNMCNMMASMGLLIADTKETADKVLQGTKTVNGVIGQVVTISEQIGNAVEEIARGTSEQADDSEKAVVKNDELEEKIDRVGERMISIQAVSDSTMELTKNSTQTVHRLISKVQETNEIMKEVLKDIHSMDKFSQVIGNIVTVINNIGEQTNLLALNASIEAARAGSAGQGFGVVAEEIKKLADQSMNATREISAIVENIQAQTKETLSKAMSSEELIESQNESLVRTTKSLDSISLSMVKLVTKVHEIRKDVSEMEECKNSVLCSIQNISAVSEETAAMSEEVAASAQKQIDEMQELHRKSDNLEDSAIHLKESVLKFKI